MKKRQSIGLPAAGHVPAAGSGLPFITPRLNVGSFTPVRSTRPSACRMMLIEPAATSERSVPYYQRAGFEYPQDALELYLGNE